MNDPDPKETLREFREYFARSYEAQYKLAARIRIDFNTLAFGLADKVKPKARTIARLRVLLDARLSNDWCRVIARSRRRLWQSELTAKTTGLR